MERNSGRAVGRILGISKNIYLYWIKKYAKTITNKSYPNERVEVIEMDELYSFVERKKQNLRSTFVSRAKDSAKKDNIIE